MHTLKDLKQLFLPPKQMRPQHIEYAHFRNAERHHIYSRSAGRWVHWRGLGWWDPCYDWRIPQGILWRTISRTTIVEMERRWAHPLLPPPPHFPASASTSTSSSALTSFSSDTSGAVVKMRWGMPNAKWKWRWRTNLNLLISSLDTCCCCRWWLQVISDKIRRGIFLCRFWRRS